jgi:hypothetical protein
MATEIYNNLHPKIAKHIDERLRTVDTVAALPDPTVAENFLYEGALAYVGGSIDEYYKCVLNGTLEWQLFKPADLVEGTINIIPGTTVLDLSLTSPAIDKCYAVRIGIVGGTSATIQSITNFPTDGQQITFYTTSGKQITFKHTDYAAASTNQIVLEVGFDMTLKGRLVGDDSLTLKKHGVAICQWDATQFTSASEWAQNLLSIAVVDNLTTTSATTALSANQGVILDNKINTKQQVLSAGDKIQLTPGGLSTTIDALVRNWDKFIPTSSPSSVVDTLTFLTGTNIPVSSNNQYVDLRLLPSQAGGDRGLWLLPPKKNGTLPGSWVMIDAPSSAVKHASYSYVDDTSPSTKLVSNFYYPRLNTLSLKGDDLGLTFNTDGPTDEKVSFALNSKGLYVITVDLVIELTSIAAARYFQGTLFVSNGVTTAASPISGGIQRRNIPSSDNGLNYPTRFVQLTFTYTTEITTVGTANAFVFQLKESGDNWTSTRIYGNSLVQITKMR